MFAEPAFPINVPSASLPAIAMLELQLQRHGQRGRHLQTGCLLLACAMWLDQSQWRCPFVQLTKPFSSHLAIPGSAVFEGGRLPQGAQPPVRGSCLLWLPSLALLGTVTHRPGVACFVRERLRGSAPPRNRQGSRKSRGSKGDDPRILTSKIKKAETVAALLGVLDSAVDSPIFNHIHASAACTSLAAFNQKGMLQAVDATSPVIQRLASRIEVLIKANEVGPRELANVLWAFAKMFAAIPAVRGAMPALVRGVAATAKGMNAQALANSLWAAAQLQDACPEVLEIAPALVAQIPGKAGDMIPQDLSNILLAAAKLQDVAPVVLEALQAIATEIPGKVGDMIPQALSNSLWAAAKLQDAVPEVLSIVPALVVEILAKVGRMNPQNLSNVLWAAANLHDKDSVILKVVAVVVKQITQKPGAMNPQDLASNLLAAARLQDATPEVLQVVQAIVAQIPSKAGRMNLQEVSNSLFAAMRLADAVPEVVEAVPSLVKEVPSKIGSMTPQDLANSLEALVALEERVAIVELPGIVTIAAARLKRILPEVKDKELALDVPMVLWACGTLGTYNTELLAAARQRFASSKSISSLPDWGVCALAWTYRRLDEQTDVAGFLDRLESEISKRGLREEEVLATRG